MMIESPKVTSSGGRMSAPSVRFSRNAAAARSRGRTSAAAAIASASERVEAERARSARGSGRRRSTIRSPCARLTSRMMPKISDEAGRVERIEAAEQHALDEGVEPGCHASAPEIGGVDRVAGQLRRAPCERHAALHASNRRGRRPASACTMSCSTTTTPCPRALIVGKRGVDVADHDGARPRLISSQSRRRGLDISARPIATICCWPPESVRARAASRRSARIGNSS